MDPGRPFAPHRSRREVAVLVVNFADRGAAREKDEQDAANPLNRADGSIDAATPASRSRLDDVISEKKSRRALKRRHAAIFTASEMHECGRILS